MATFYDTHAHLDYQEFALDINEIIQRARAAGITRMISIGTDLDSSRRAIELAEKHPNIYAAVGWHPSEAVRAPQDFRPALRELVKHPRVAAVGEIFIACRAPLTRPRRKRMFRTRRNRRRCLSSNLKWRPNAG